MDSIKYKKTVIQKIMNVLKKSYISDENYDSTKQPFFLSDTNVETFNMNYTKIQNIPENLNRNIQLIYTLLGNPNKEIYIGDWILFSLNKAFEIYKEYHDNGQGNIFDIGYKYLGLGNIEIISCDLTTHLLFYHPGGGSNGWVREENFQKIIKNGSKNYNQFFFSKWFYTL